MNKESEYRVWNTQKKKMHQVYWLEFSDKGLFGYDMNDILIGCEPHDIFMRRSDLKDVSGKTIWEGDVYRSKFSQHNRYAVSIVNGAFVGGTSKGQKAPLAWDTKYEDDIITPDGSDYIEVIGNIYENPELTT